LNWYASKLITHADSILNAANTIFNGKDIILGVKISGIYWLYNTSSHAAELTAGYYNTYNYNGYKDIAVMLAKYKAVFIITGYELTNAKTNDANANCKCAPEDLITITRQTAWDAGIGYGAENANAFYDSDSFNQIIRQSYVPYGDTSKTITSFTYARLNSSLLESQNLNNFMNFVFTMHYINRPPISTVAAVIISFSVIFSVFLIGFISYRVFMKYYGRKKITTENQQLKEPLLGKLPNQPESEPPSRRASEIKYAPANVPEPKIDRRVNEQDRKVSEQAGKENTYAQENNPTLGSHYTQNTGTNYAQGNTSIHNTQENISNVDPYYTQENTSNSGPYYAQQNTSNTAPEVLEEHSNFQVASDEEFSEN